MLPATLHPQDKSVKTCHLCNLTKPLEAFYASQRGSRCIACLLARTAAYYRANIGLRRKQGLEANRRRRAVDVERERVIQRGSSLNRAFAYRQARDAWAAAHPDLAALIRSIRKEIVAARHKEKKALTLAKKPERMRRNSAAFYLAHKAERQAYLKQWRAENAARCNSHRRKRDVLKANAFIDDPRAVADFYERAKNEPRIRCYYCNKATLKGERHVDHVTPIVKGGAHAVFNLVIACPTCNLKKHAKMPNEIGLLF